MSTRRVARHGLLYAALMVSAFGCRPFEVVEQATPNPFAGQKSFAYRPLDFDNITVDGNSESSFAAGLDSDQLSKWEEDKRAIENEFRNALEAGLEDDDIEILASSTAATAEIRPMVHAIETGFYRIPAWNANAEIELTVEVAAGGGGRDVIRMRLSIPWDVFNPSSGGRLRVVARRSGAATASYLRSRVEG